MFEGYDILHIEGYLVQDTSLILRAVQLAKEAGLSVSFDMASYNVVKDNYAIIRDLVENYVDILFANEEEALAYTGEEPRKATEILSRYCRIAVVKCGAQGSFVGREGIITEVPATPEVRVDSTGAGDLYASGFLYGLSQNCSLGVCGAIGSLLAGRVIKVIGTKMSDEIWTEIKLKVSSMLPKIFGISYLRVIKRSEMKNIRLTFATVTVLSFCSGFINPIWAGKSDEKISKYHVTLYNSFSFKD